MEEITIKTDDGKVLNQIDVIQVLDADLLLMATSSWEKKEYYPWRIIKAPLTENIDQFSLVLCECMKCKSQQEIKLIELHFGYSFTCEKCLQLALKEDEENEERE